MAEKLVVKEKGKLLDFMFANLNGWSKKTIKQRLQNSTVTVNSKFITKHDYMLEKNDLVEVGVTQKASPNGIKKLEIIYQDKYIIAINKPAGLLSVSTASENKEHALGILRAQLSKGKNQVKLWPVHRLDRDTSGVLLFATSKELREKVMDNWPNSQKIYLAIVQGSPKQKSGTINEPLRLDEKEYRMHVGAHPDAKSAITHYEVKEVSNARSLLEVKIETGRQHQIRAHMAWLGNSIVGDQRYGENGDRMGLHAKKLIIIHPNTNKKMSFEIDAKGDFYQLLNK